MVGTPNEQAVLTVNGMNYDEWVTVLVRHAMMEVPPFMYRFTCSESVPIADNWGALQIKPGDTCSVTLAGQLAVTGEVYSRQVFYDGRRHHIEIMGGSSIAAAKTAFASKTREFKDVKFQQLAEAGLKQIGQKMQIVGGSLPDVKFPRVSVPPGQSIYDTLDTYGRMLGINFTSNPQGDFVFATGPAAGNDTVTEGVDIVEGREIIYSPTIAGGIAMGQRPADDKTWGTKAAIPYVKHDMLALGQKIPQVILNEVPAWTDQHLKGRIQTDRAWQSQDMVTVFATVYGWERASGGLWNVGQIVHVKSPMLIMDDDLIAKSINFTQDDRKGTRTTLELCNKMAYNQGLPVKGWGDS